MQIFSLPLEGQIYTTVIKSTQHYPPRISEAAATNYKNQRKRNSYERKVIVQEKGRRHEDGAIHVMDPTMMPSSCDMLYNLQNSCVSAS